MELDILETTLLPSDVIKIKFYRPPNFKFLSGKIKLFIEQASKQLNHSFIMRYFRAEVTFLYKYREL
jgi:dual oxidase